MASYVPPAGYDQSGKLMKSSAPKQQSAGDRSINDLPKLNEEPRVDALQPSQLAEEIEFAHSRCLESGCGFPDCNSFYDDSDSDSVRAQ